MWGGFMQRGMGRGKNKKIMVCGAERSGPKSWRVYPAPAPPTPIAIPKYQLVHAKAYIRSPTRSNREGNKSSHKERWKIVPACIWGDNIDAKELEMFLKQEHPFLKLETELPYNLLFLV